MTIAELQILLNLHCGNEADVLEEHTSLTDYGYLFVDSEDGHCYLFDINGKTDGIRKLKELHDGDVKKDIKKIVIPNSVESIGEMAFVGCTSLTSIKIPDSVKSIGERAFWYCTSLTNIKIPENVEHIGEKAFRDCTSLKEVIFKGKTMDQVMAMDWYPWDIKDESIN